MNDEPNRNPVSEPKTELEAESTHPQLETPGAKPEPLRGRVAANIPPLLTQQTFLVNVESIFTTSHELVVVATDEEEARTKALADLRYETDEEPSFSFVTALSRGHLERRLEWLNEPPDCE